LIVATWTNAIALRQLAFEAVGRLDI